MTCIYCDRAERSGGLCAVHQRRRTLWQPMAQPHDLVGQIPSGYGLLGIVERDENAVMCHECGRWLGGLAWHITKVHGMTVARYRLEHQLPAGVPLVSLGTSALISEQSKARIGSARWQRFEAGRDATIDDSRLEATRASSQATAGTKAARAKRASEQFTGGGRADEDRWDERLTAYLDHWSRVGTPPRQTADDPEERALACWMSHNWRHGGAALSPHRRDALVAAGIPLGSDAARGRKWRQSPPPAEAVSRDYPRPQG